MVELNIKLPDYFLDEEVRCGCLVSSKMKEIWAVELDLLAKLLEVCKKHDIKMWVDGGTMLGAVRHQGFIPWDDDIDVIMTRKQYNKLCSIAATEFEYPYFFQTEYTDPGSLRGHAQLRNSQTTGILKTEMPYQYQFNQGIFIDIFPLDFLPDDPSSRAEYITKVEKMRNWSRRFVDYTSRKNNLGKGWKYKLACCIHFIYRHWKIKNHFFYKFERVVNKGSRVPTKEIGKLFVSPIREKSIWQWKLFNSTIEMPFEMLTVPVPAGYNEILTRFYGKDWQTPKHESSFHGGVFFDTNVSYNVYINKYNEINHIKKEEVPL